MDTRLLTSARETLVTERARLVAELSEEVESPGQMTYGSQAAAAAQVFEQQRGLALREHAAQHLAAVEAALRRLDEGSFGTCRRCGKPIGDERLEALPWASDCIDCHRLADRGQA